MPATAETTTTLPPLTEAMTAKDLIAHERALRQEFPGGGVTLSFIDSGVFVSFRAYGRYETDKTIYGDTWPDAITAARAFLATHATVHRDNRIRAMALAVIDLTDQFGRCDRAMLARREFSGAEIDALKDAACVRASEMSANSPFSVEG